MCKIQTKGYFVLMEEPIFYLDGQYIQDKNFLTTNRVEAKKFNSEQEALEYKDSQGIDNNFKVFHIS